MGTGILQGIIFGGILAFITVQIIVRIKATKVNGWITIFGCGLPGNSMWLRAACTRMFPGPVNVPQEAMYWRTRVDGAGHILNGQHTYTLNFPPGGLPPNDAFWSLTMGNAKNRFVPNPINRYSISDRLALVPNADGSVTIYIQNAVPAGHESNWLPAPAGTFILWLRVYMPGAVILNGEYTVPPVVESEMPSQEKHKDLLTVGSIRVVVWTLGVCAFIYFMIPSMERNLLTVSSLMVVSWFLFIYFWPRLLLYAYKRAILVQGFGEGPIPINTLYTESQTLFADPLHPPASGSKLAVTGVNRDTLLTVGWLNLNKEPQILYVPEMAGRYYSVQFTDPSNNTNFAYVGKRTTGTEAGVYLITGPTWKGEIPDGIAQLSSPNNSVLVIGRVFVESDSDLPNAYALAKQLQLIPLSQWHLSQTWISR
ncbi:MAG TPA: DUF1254 domain-containing protein [Chloroflexia bacterium]|nr:DUF1254 domain-containing protein [Chloroflexia bacterium]